MDIHIEAYKLEGDTFENHSHKELIDTILEIKDDVKIEDIKSNLDIYFCDRNGVRISGLKKKGDLEDIQGEEH